MASREHRRRFLGLLGMGASAPILLAAAHEAGASPGEEDPKKGKAKKQVFKGTSKKGDLKEALDLAIQAALKSAPGADRLVEWTLKEVSGRRGGVAGFNEVTVTIEASIP